MMSIGLLWSGPVGLTYFWFINPWYLKHVVPRLFPRWTNNFSKWKKVLSSILIDNFVTLWFLCSLKIYCTALIGSHGDVKASWEGLKNRLWPTVRVVWCFRPIVLAFLYGLVPMHLRGITSSGTSAFTSALFSYVQHNY